MSILHFYSLNSQICINIMYVCNKWLIKKTWFYESPNQSSNQSSNESTTFAIMDKYDSNIFIYDLIKCTYDLNTDIVTMEITKNDKPIIYDIIAPDNHFNSIVNYLTYLKEIDRDEIDRFYKSYIIANTKNILTKTFPSEIIDHIVDFI